MAAILADVDACFDADPLIDEFGFILEPPPPNVILVEHKLGLSFKVLKPLFIHAATEFHALLRRIRDGDSILLDPLIMADVLRYTRAVLLVRGDMPMAYNMRKKILGHDTQPAAAIVQELSFLKVLFTKHPKSPSSWEHRRWCIRRLQCLTAHFNVLNDTDMRGELDLCSSMAEVYPKNYYAWMHRRWLLHHMTLGQLAGELDFSRQWLTSHVSDHSASNHRDQVIGDLLACINQTCGSCGFGGSDSNSTSLMDFMVQRIDVIVSQRGAVLGSRLQRVRDELTCASSSVNNSSSDNKSSRSSSASSSSGSSSSSSSGNSNSNSGSSRGSKHNPTAIHTAQCYMLLFLESAMAESRALILHRPGHETLWYHRRNVFNAYLGLLSDVFGALWQAALGGGGSSGGGGIGGTGGTGGVSIPEGVFEITSGGGSTAPVGGEGDVVEGLLGVLGGLRHPPTSLNAPPSSPTTPGAMSDDHLPMLAWLVSRITDEVQFVRACVEEESSWDHALQQTMARRYHCYVLFALTPRGVRSQGLRAGAGAGAGADTSRRQPPSHPPQPLTDALMTTSTAPTTPSEFLRAVATARRRAAAMLRQEDGLERLWPVLATR